MTIFSFKLVMKLSKISSTNYFYTVYFSFSPCILKVLISLLLTSPALKVLKCLNNRLCQKEYFRLQHYESNDRFISNINIINQNTSSNSSSATTVICLSSARFLDESSETELDNFSIIFNYLQKDQLIILETDKVLSNEVAGLRTQCKPGKSIIAPKGTVELENFSLDIAREILQ